MSFFTGVTTALITPFKKGEVDYKSLKQLITSQLDHKIQGFVVAGSTGEAATLLLDEKQKILNFVLNVVSNQVPVLMGIGTFSTDETCHLAKVFEKTKPAGFLVVTPYYNRPPQRGLFQHYSKLAEATQLPIVIYNVPARTSIKIDVETVSALAKEHRNIVGIKEATGDLDLMKQFIKNGSKKFSVLSGDDGTFLSAIEAGADGVISVISHVIPKQCLEKNAEHVRLVTSALFCESNPIPLKWALAEMGIIESSELRLPLVELDKKFHKMVKETLTRVGVL